MSADPNSVSGGATPATGSLTKVLFRIFVCLCILFVAVAVLGPFILSFVSEFVVTLATGWWKFLFRVLPRMSLNWDLLGMATVCSIFIIFGTHRFLGRISRHLAKGLAVGPTEFRWPWRWTWCGLVALGLTFLIGSAVTGAVHQIGWLLNSHEPWFEVRGRAAYAESFALANRCQIALAESDSNLRKLREHLNWKDSSSLRGSEEIRQRYHLLALLADNDKVSTLVIFPRDASQRARLGAMVATKELREHVLAMELDEWLRSHQARLVAL